MSERVDFSANATIYDRRHGAALADDDLDRIWKAARLQRGARVLDIGAGTGRVTIPFARRSCSVVAVEPARDMLAELRSKAAEHKVLAVLGEGSALPFSRQRFDGVVIARLLYLTPDWRGILREGHRVLAAGGCLLHEWGNGQADEEWVQIREEARKLFEDAGVRAPFHPGVRSETEVDEELENLRLVREGRLDIGPGPTISHACRHSPCLPSEAKDLGAIEVYPAATLRVRGISTVGYKKKEQVAARAAIVNALTATASLPTNRDCLTISADALDAAICAIAGADFVRGNCMPPDDIVAAKREGWIWVHDPSRIGSKPN